MDIDTNDLDLLHEPSQYWNNFEYMKCDYQCTYEHVFFLWSIWYAKSYWRETIHKWFFWVYYWGEICFVKNVRLLNVNANAYKCSECELNCSSKAELINYLLDHNIYACDKCQYKNNSAQGLIAHAKIHSFKKFQCSKCDFKGTSSNSLNAHMKTHMDEIEPSLQDIVSQGTQASKRGLSASPDSW